METLFQDSSRRGFALELPPYLDVYDIAARSKPSAEGGQAALAELVDAERWKKEVASYGFRQLYEFLNGVLYAWLSPHTFVTTLDFTISDEEFVKWAAFGYDHMTRIYVCRRLGTAEPIEALKPIFRLLANDKPEKIKMFNVVFLTVEDCPLSPDTLACYLQVCGGHETCLEFAGLNISREQCQQLAAFRGSLSFLNNGSFADGGSSIFDAVASNQGPQKLSLTLVEVDQPALQNALRLSTSLRELVICSPIFGLDIPPLLHALEQNKSLVKFTVNCPISVDGYEGEKVWVNHAFQSLSAHPTLEKFEFYTNIRFDVQEARQKRYGQVILKLLQENTVLQELAFARGLLGEQFIRDQVQPRLLQNRYRPRFQAIAEEPNEPFQSALAMMALTHSEVHRNPNLMRMVVSKFHAQVAQQYELANSKASVKMLEPAKKKQRLT